MPIFSFLEVFKTNMNYKMKSAPPMYESPQHHIADSSYPRFGVRPAGNRTEQFLMKGYGLDLIAIGNPGSGKSTLWSSCSSQEFESGPSFTGSGITQTFKFRQDQRFHRYYDVRWGDTPGLTDPLNPYTAAKSITAAIQESTEKQRAVKLIFIVTLKQGRIARDDLRVEMKKSETKLLSDFHG